jgi:hypothetical protein
MDVNARCYQESNYFILKVMTYSLTKDLTDELEADSFHSYKFNLIVEYTRELEKATYSSS